MRRSRILVALPALVAGLIAAAPAAAAPEPVFALDPLTNELVIKPSQLSLREREMRRLRWRRWGEPVARARGIARILTCDPDCASGGAVKTGTVVKLSRIRERNGRLRYTCMSWWDDEQVTDLPARGSLNPFNLRRCKAPPPPRG
jgi:hypothetical protein